MYQTKEIMKIFKLDYCGVKLEVEGCYYKGVAPEPDEFEIERVWLIGDKEDRNITELLELQMDDLKELILNKYY